MGGMINIGGSSKGSVLDGLGVGLDEVDRMQSGAQANAKGGRHQPTPATGDLKEKDLIPSVELCAENTHGSADGSRRR